MTIDRFRFAGTFLVFIALHGGCRDRVASTRSNLSESMRAERLEEAERNLTELDLASARTVLDAIVDHRLDFYLLKARLAIAAGDCAEAVTVLSNHGTRPWQSPSQPSSPPPVALPESTRSQYATELFTVAEGCSSAMAGAESAVDEAHGVWVRFQNSHDRVLLPLIADTADRAATAIGRHLGTTLPRPLRIELVSDLPSLAKVTGLPLEAAETTGTIAIARWGKVTLVSPRATPDGYPWQDTLAHELAHLVVARQSRDGAPLWLQEGIAKREETRWRNRMPLDEVEDAHDQAKRALLEGRTVGIEHLGTSIALLPNPKAAETAYAEVRDFLDYWVQYNGEPALTLLLRDLAGRGADSVDRALVSVSGYTLSQWILRWQDSLLKEPRQQRRLPHDTGMDKRGQATDDGAPGFGVDAARRLRLAEMLEERRHYPVVAEQLAPFEKTAQLPPELAHRSALALLMLGRMDAAKGFVSWPRVTHLDGTWLAIRGRVLATTGDPVDAETAFLQSLAFAPTLDKVACRGFSAGEFESSGEVLIPPGTEPWLSLCRAARVP
jgi:hypothetical protein